MMPPPATKTVLPEKTPVKVPPAVAVPSMALLTAIRLAVASPVGPMSPELPEMATGLASAVEVAGPVLPLLVADDCAHDRPESPEMAVGLAVTLAPPPFPPLALAVAAVLP